MEGVLYMCIRRKSTQPATFSSPGRQGRGATTIGVIYAWEMNIMNSIGVQVTTVHLIVDSLQTTTFPLPWYTVCLFQQLVLPVTCNELEFDPSRISYLRLCYDELAFL